MHGAFESITEVKADLDTHIIARRTAEPVGPYASRIVNVLRDIDVDTLARVYEEAVANMEYANIAMDAVTREVSVRMAESPGDPLMGDEWLIRRPERPGGKVVDPDTLAEVLAWPEMTPYLRLVEPALTREPARVRLNLTTYRGIRKNLPARVAEAIDSAIRQNPATAGPIEVVHIGPEVDPATGELLR